MSGEGGLTAMDELEERRLAIIRPYLLPVDEHGNPRSAIEAARQFGVDIEQLERFRQLTPTQRLQHLEAMMEFVVTARASLERQKGQEKRAKEQARLRQNTAPARRA